MGETEWSTWLHCDAVFRVGNYELANLYEEEDDEEEEMTV